MKQTQKDEIRKSYIADLLKLYNDHGEDVDYIASNAINFPIATEDGEECVIEVYVKIPKSDEDSLSKREEYKLKCEERKAKAEESSKKKAEKIAKDKAEREAKAKAKEEKTE